MSTPTGISQHRRGEYLKLLEIHNTNRIDYNVRKWETLKYFQSIVSSLIGGTVVALTVGIDRGLFCKSFAFSSVFTAAVAALPIIVVVASVFAILNLGRETALLFAEEAECFKIAKLLELDIDVPPDKRWIPGDTWLLMPKWRRWSYGITTPSPDKMDFKEWVQQRSTDHCFRRRQNLLFEFEMFMAFILLICLITAYSSAQFDFPSVHSCSTSQSGGPNERSGK